ncbi:unnamed protein product [Durusdinium trenchii]|uniref:Ankyrin repeat domain-containing protein n=1 Tax=Durusdinium trenchii TaxID=1381693 RepID=A0ABP0LI17_9DINO
MRGNEPGGMFLSHAFLRLVGKPWRRSASIACVWAVKHWHSGARTGACVKKDFPVDYDATWAKHRKPWEVWLDAFDAWDRERKRLCEVYLRRTEGLDAAAAADVYQGKFPRAPAMPESMLALYQAAYDGDIVKLADLLEDEELDISCRDHNLQTPLMFAAMAGSLECVEYLVDMGADLGMMDRSKDTAFDLAIDEHAERFPEHPVLLFFRAVEAPRGQGLKSKLPSR